jgi:hypothetical protein
MSTLDDVVFDYGSDSEPESESETETESETESESSECESEDIDVAAFDIDSACNYIEECVKEMQGPINTDCGKVTVICDVCENQACDSSVQNLILKEQQINSEFVNEVAIMRRLAEVEYTDAPRILRAFTCNGVGYIIMQRAVTCKKVHTREKIKQLCQDLYDETGILHMDAHAGNVMCDENGTPQFIDFGLSLDTKNPDAVKTLIWHDPQDGIPRFREGSKREWIWKNLAWSMMMHQINHDVFGQGRDFTGPLVSEVTGGPYNERESPLYGLSPKADSPQQLLCKSDSLPVEVRNYFQKITNGCSVNFKHKLHSIDYACFSFEDEYRKIGSL